MKLRAFLAAYLTLIAGIALTALAYQGTIPHAKVYEVLITSAVDIYRFNLLKALHQPMPLDLTEEKKTAGKIDKIVIPKLAGKAPNICKRSHQNLILYSVNSDATQ